MENEYIVRTTSFTKLGTWVKRIFWVLTCSGLVFFTLLEKEELMVQLFPIAILSLVILLARKDDLAVDDQYLYHLQTSIIPKLSKVSRFKLANIKSLRWKAYRSVLHKYFLSRSLGGLNEGIEMTFNDKTSISLSPNLNKRDLDRVLSVANEKLND